LRRLRDHHGGVNALRLRRLRDSPHDAGLSIEGITVYVLYVEALPLGSS
jgi:hypothetical protein